jgi:hypothetical protein
MAELKQTIRSGQFSPDELAALVTEGVISQEVVDVLLAHPIGDEEPEAEEAEEAEAEAEEDAVEETEDEAPEGTTAKGNGKKKGSVTGDIVKRITAVLEEAGTGLTIEEICIELGVLPEDADSTDSDVKGIKKRYRTFARKAVDGHPDGSRDENLGRNRLYSIGEVEERTDEDVEEAEEVEA